VAAGQDDVEDKKKKVAGVLGPADAKHIAESPPPTAGGESSLAICVGIIDAETKKLPEGSQPDQEMATRVRLKYFERTATPEKVLGKDYDKFKGKTQVVDSAVNLYKSYGSQMLQMKQGGVPSGGLRGGLGGVLGMGDLGKGSILKNVEDTAQKTARNVLKAHMFSR
jgi:hypothetical protein